MHWFHLPVKLSHQDAGNNRTRQGKGDGGGLSRDLSSGIPEDVNTEGESEVSQQARQAPKRWGKALSLPVWSMQPWDHGGHLKAHFAPNRDKEMGYVCIIVKRVAENATEPFYMRHSPWMIASIFTITIWSRDY